MKCEIMVWERGGWHKHRCDFNAKHTIKLKDSGRELQVCGTHRRSHERHPYREFHVT